MLSTSDQCRRLVWGPLLIVVCDMVVYLLPVLVLQAMSSSTAEARAACSSWQAQAQDSLVTISRLQDLLAEAAAPHGSSAADGTAEAPDEEAGRLRAALLQQQVQAASLELQVKVLGVQLLRSHAAAKQASSSVIPLLSGVEARLLALKARTSA